jgi:hypothetical protein
MPETQNIEWKTTWRDEYLKWICGFANVKCGKKWDGVPVPNVSVADLKEEVGAGTVYKLIGS